MGNESTMFLSQLKNYLRNEEIKETEMLMVKVVTSINDYYQYVFPWLRKTILDSIELTNQLI